MKQRTNNGNSPLLSEHRCKIVYACQLILLMSLYCAAIAVLGCGYDENEIAPESAPAATVQILDPDPDLASQRQTAATRGIEYLLSRADKLSASWKRDIFSILVKIAPNDELAEACRIRYREGLLASEIDLPAVYELKILRRPRNLRSVVGELERRKLLDDDWQTPVKAFAELIARHEDRLWKEMQPTQRIVLMHQFDQLGIETRMTRDDVIADLISRWASEDHGALVLETPFVLGVTHVIFTDSDYSDRLVDPNRYRSLIPILDRAIDSYTANFPERAIFIDVAAEVLSARKLMGLPETPPSRSLQQKLMEMQQTDGRWGEQRRHRDIHATSTAVHALIDYPVPFRPLDQKSMTTH